MITTSVSFLHANRLSYELKHLFFKYVHDNVVQQLDKNTMSVYREIESLYLLIALSQIGKEYWLPESTLMKHFLIKEDDNTGEYQRSEFMSHFSITVLLSYIKSKTRYAKLLAFIEAHVIEKLSDMSAHCPNDTEALVLFLDLIVCPYIGDTTKVMISNIFGLDTAKLTTLLELNDHWFTAWGDKFDLGKELDTKRSREVY